MQLGQNYPRVSLLCRGLVADWTTIASRGKKLSVLTNFSAGRAQLLVTGDEGIVSESSLEEVELHTIRIAKLEMLHATWEGLDLRNTETRPDDSCSIVLDVLTFESEMVRRATGFIRFFSERYEEFQSESAFSEGDKSLLHRRVLVPSRKLEPKISAVERYRSL
jgi:hypothetical protein